MNSDPHTLDRSEIRDLCAELGFDPALVTMIVIHPTVVEVTVAVPIVERPPTPPAWLQHDDEDTFRIVDRD